MFRLFGIALRPTCNGEDAMSVGIVGIAGQPFVAFLHYAVIALPFHPEVEDFCWRSFGWGG
jgi:hypothetical protein